MWRTEWVVVGGFCVGLVVFGFIKHVYYVIKNVWLVKRALDKPQRVLPAPGPVTLNGIVSGIGDEIPVQVTIVEHGVANRGQIAWRQTSYKVEAHPFVLLLPELGVRIVVKPGERVHLRAFATVTDWEHDEERNEDRRVRTSILDDGDQVMITGILEEKREVDLIASEYRSQKEKIRTEYVLNPDLYHEMRIDSETLLHEIKLLLGPLGWVRTISTAVLVSAYVSSVSEGLSTGGYLIFGALLAATFLTHRHYRNIDRLPWFDRPNSGRNPYHSLEDQKLVELPWR